ncbi:GMC family oxidoreductase [Frigoribacterium sp. CG_9.8]|uniref:GMC family oxidoreductase n=1 Tax=Frigoribacterium sp. CG_9.8 TaxID=2787733 RepID=UPI0018CAFDE9|nr:GMC family oxidoreductase N-terminal domain-containing protein [Frigoribacterium sp. CG_9.8]MBG6106933.1 choline dehydrogenase [Frigoribacterium sp. CG_9.8]
MTMRDPFDYVVVGAGASGAALAAKLTEDGSHTVLLLEAGAVDKKAEVHIPAAFSALFRSELDWNYDTTPQPQLADRTIYWPRGKMLGGSSSINAMMWVRGFAADYDHWAKTAGPTWSYSALLPYFRSVERVEGNTDPDQGSGGAISIEHQRSPRSHTATFLKAVVQAGYSVVAPNTALPDGFSQTMVSQKKGKRFSSADGYLVPAKTRANLTVRTNAQATRVLFDGSRATGVEYVLDGVTTQATARREVVLCGGAVNTPQLLMLSGIGPRAQLERHGIPVLVDSPEVGENMRDHLLSGLIVETPGDTLFTAKKVPELVKFLARGRGMLTSNVAEAYGFVRSDPSLELPDIEIIFAPVAFIGEGLVPAPAHGITIGAILLKPESTGTVTLASADPLAAPVIDPRYLSDSGGSDRARLMAGLGICEDILQAPALQATTGPHFLAPEGADSLGRVERDAVALETAAHTIYHPVGTARMGTDAASVVDEQLRVRGVLGLRVADASVMPDIIRGHTQAPSMVIGEKAADLLLQSAQLGAPAAASVG